MKSGFKKSVREPALVDRLARLDFLSRIDRQTGFWRWNSNACLRIFLFLFTFETGRQDRSKQVLWQFSGQAASLKISIFSLFFQNKFLVLWTSIISSKSASLVTPIFLLKSVCSVNDSPLNLSSKSPSIIFFAAFSKSLYSFVH